MEADKITAQQRFHHFSAIGEHFEYIGAWPGTMKRETNVHVRILAPYKSRKQKKMGIMDPN